MPIGSIFVYNAGDLILSTVSSSDNTFQENKIAAATSSIILFDSNGRINSQSLNITTTGTASSLVVANNYQINNLNANQIIASSITGSFSGSVFSSSNAFVRDTLTVNGSIVANSFSSSTVYVTASSLIIGDNIVTLNSATPSLRYAGIEMIDSGSQTLSSLLWDSQNNYMFVSSSELTASRQIILGPLNESNLTPNFIPLISGSNNITTSIIYQTQNNIGIGTINPVNRLDVIGNISASAITSSVMGTTNSTTLALITNGSYRLRIDGNGRAGLNTAPLNSIRFTIADNRSGSTSSSSLYVATTLNQATATAGSGNENGIYSDFTITGFNTASTATSLQNQATFNSMNINASGSFSGSYRCFRNGISINNTCSLHSAGSLVNHYMTNQTIANLPAFSIPNWYSGTLVSVFENTSGTATGSVTNLIAHYVGTPWNSITAITTSNAYGLYIDTQKGASNGVTTGWGIRQQGANDVNAFLGFSTFGTSTTQTNNRLACNGGAAIGSTYYSVAAPTNGLIVQGNVGIGTNAPVNRLDVAGNISCSVVTASIFSGSVSGSVFGTSSWSTNSLTASYLVTTNNYLITDLTASGKIIYRNAVLLDYNSSNMPSTISTVIQNATGSYNAAFFDYAIFSSSNSRAGTIVSTWNGGSIVYNETCTTDIGNTSQITMAVALNAGNVQLLASGSVTNWNIKASGRYI